MALARRRGGGGGAVGRPRTAGRSGDNMGGGLAPASFVSLRGAERRLSVGRSRDLLQQLNAEQQNRSWRQGMTIAFAQANTLARQTAFVDLLGLKPFGSGSLEVQPSLLLAFLSKGSPVGRWTVTIRPRGEPLADEPNLVANQLQLFITVGDQLLRLLRVKVRVDASPGGVAAARGLIGELVEDSLIRAPGGDSYKADEDVQMFMVLGVKPEEGFLWLDATRRWRRRRLPSGALRLVEEVVSGQEAVRLDPEAHLIPSTAYSCNCPSYAGLELQDLRPRWGKQGLGQDRYSRLGAPQDALNGDPTEQVARRFDRGEQWERQPLRCCKHVHAARWLTGCPIAEPGDANVPGDPYWTNPRDMARQEEMVSPLNDARYMEQMSEIGANDAVWRDLDALPLTVSAGDALSVIPVQQQLRILEKMTLSPPPETAPAAFQERLDLGIEGVNLVDGNTRFTRAWPVGVPEAIETSVLGDVWCGAGTTPTAFPFEAPGQLADTPFVTPRNDPVAVPP